METSKPFNQLEVEVLLAKLNIRDHVISSIVKSIYESTGQLLSLVRMKLTIIEKTIPQHLKQHLNETNDLTSQAAIELREISRNLYPENQIVEEKNLKLLVERIFEPKEAGSTNQLVVNTSGTAFELPATTKLILFSLLFDLADEVKQSQKFVKQITVDYNQADLTIWFFLPTGIDTIIQKFEAYENRLLPIAAKLSISFSDELTLLKIQRLRL